MPLTAGITAPDFDLLDEGERVHRLSDYRGQPVVLYFYPRDDTPGCIKEACGFRDDYSAYRDAGVVILGVSTDTPESHARFKKKYDLPFTLLADTERKIVEMYKVWGPKKFMGREHDGIYRTTYLIGPEGRIRKVFENVRPADHSSEIIEALEDLS